MADHDSKTSKLASHRVSVVVLGDVEVESVIMRDPEESVVPISDRPMASAGHPAHFYFRMPGGAWMLEETIRVALEAASVGRRIDVGPRSVGGFCVGWAPFLEGGDSATDSTVSVWPTLAPRSAIEIDLFPRVPADEKDKVFRIRHGHVTGWMQRAIEGLPISVANILNALRAFGVCYKFYRDQLKTHLDGPATLAEADPKREKCREWLDLLKTTLYAYIADNSEHRPESGLRDAAIPALLDIGKWLQKSRNSVDTARLGELLPHLEAALKSNLSHLPESVSRPTRFADKQAAEVLSQSRQDAVANELRNRVREIQGYILRLSAEAGEPVPPSILGLVAEYVLVISMKVQLVRLSINSQEWADVLHVKEEELTSIGDQLWHVCNQLCCSYHDSLKVLCKSIPEGLTPSVPHTPTGMVGDGATQDLSDAPDGLASDSVQSPPR